MPTGYVPWKTNGNIGSGADSSPGSAVFES